MHSMLVLILLMNLSLVECQILEDLIESEDFDDLDDR